jgi:hypothetical protein
MPKGLRVDGRKFFDGSKMEQNIWIGLGKNIDPLIVPQLPGNMGESELVDFLRTSP